MARPKFTPGPWRVDGRYIKALRGKTIAEIPCGGVKSGKVDDANRAAVAALPDLYAACAEAVRWIRDDTLIDLNDLSDDAKTVLVTLVEALAKARGEGTVPDA